MSYDDLLEQWDAEDGLTWGDVLFLAVVLGIVVALGVAGYFGFDWLRGVWR